MIKTFKTEQQKQKEKDRILTELFQSKIIHEKISGICYRNRIHHGTYIHEDILQEVFLHLSLKTPDFIIQLYYDDGRCKEGSLRRLIGLFVTIAVLKGVAKIKSGNPKHSLAQLLLWTSNFLPLSSISPTDDECTTGNNSTKVICDVTIDEDQIDTWELIRSKMTEEQINQLDEVLQADNKQLKKELKDKYQSVQQLVGTIVNKHKIQIHNTMTQDERFSNIQQLIPVLTTKEITIEQKEILKKTYQSLFPGVQVNLTCGSCINSYLNNLLAWYEREYTVFLQSKMNVEAEIKSTEADKVTTKKTRKKNVGRN